MRFAKNYRRPSDQVTHRARPSREPPREWMSASAPGIGKLSGTDSGHPTPSYGSRLMELTPSFVALLQHFSPVFTAPTLQTSSLFVTGLLLSHRHRYITEVIFSCGQVGVGHWSRFHRFFSHAAWDLDIFSMALAKLVVTGAIAPVPSFSGENVDLPPQTGLSYDDR